MQLTYFQSEQLSTFDTEDSSVLLEALPGHTEQEMLITLMWIMLKPFVLGFCLRC